MTDFDYQWIAIAVSACIAYRVVLDLILFCRWRRQKEEQRVREKLTGELDRVFEGLNRPANPGEIADRAFDLAHARYAPLIASATCTRNLASPIGLAFTAIALIVMMTRQSRTLDPSILFGDLAVALLTTAFSCVVVVVLIALLHAVETRMEDLARSMTATVSENERERRESLRDSEPVRKATTEKHEVVPIAALHVVVTRIEAALSRSMTATVSKNEKKRHERLRGSEPVHEATTGKRELGGESRHDETGDTATVAS